MQNKKIKKTIIISVASIFAIVLIVGIVMAVRTANTDPVKVFPMTSLSQTYWGDSMNLSGMVTSDVSQDIYVEANKVIKEVKVKEGDAVKEGDELILYDTTLLELDLETEKLNKQTIELKIKGIEKNITKLKKGGNIATSTEDVKGNFKRLAQVDPTYKVMDANAESYAGDGAQENPYRFRVENGVKVLGSFLKQMTTSFFVFDIYQADPTIPVKSSDLIDGSKMEEVADDADVSDRIKWIMRAADKLDFESLSYKGDGSNENPFCFVVKSNTVIMGSFLNKMAGYDNKEGKGEKGKTFCFQFELYNGDISTGEFQQAIFQNGGKLTKSDSTKKYKIENGKIVEVKPTPEPTPEPDKPVPEEDDNTDVSDLPDVDVPEGEDPGMTAEERKKAIAEQESSLKSAKIDLQESELKIKKAEKKIEDATVKSTIDGVVQKVGDVEAISQSEPFMKVSNTGGFYIKGSISELMLEKIKVGQSVMGTTYESGSSFEATIKEISPYPDTSQNNNYGGGNQNSSYYPFMAYIEDGKGLINQEYAELSMTVGADDNANAIYLDKTFIRKENGTSYVYKQEKGKLKKQVVDTGKIIWGSVIEIKSGLTIEDFIAFPYGKGLKEGTATKEAELEELYGR